MKHFIISTTALNRPDLHSKVFDDWYKLINSLNCKIIHFINIDCIDKLSYTYEDTLKNFQLYTNIIGASSDMGGKFAAGALRGELARSLLSPSKIPSTLKTLLSSH